MEADKIEPGTTAPAETKTGTKKRARQQSRRPLHEILTDLARPIPPRFIMEKPVFSKGRQSGNAKFCPWYRIQKILDHYTGGWWEYRILDSRSTEQHLITLVEITIHASDGTISRQGRGLERLDVDGYGDPASNSESMAFRRAAAHFGLGLDLYDKEV